MTEPFAPAFGNRPSRFVDREREIAAFAKGLQGPGGHPNRALLFTGQRGMGKTALLLELAAQAEQFGFVAAKATADDGLLDELLEVIQANGMKRVPKGKPLKGFNVGALGFSVGLTFNDHTQNSYGFRVKLGLLCDALAERGLGVVLLVDEVTASSPELRKLVTTYQELVGEGKNIAIAMAGLPTAVSRLLNDQVLTFLNRASKFRLEPIPVHEIVSLYVKEFRSLGKSMSAEDFQRAAEATLGYPYLLQLIGYYLLDFAGEAESIDAPIVELAIANSRKALASTVFEPSLAPLSARDVEFLRAMSVDTGPSAVDAIAQRLGYSRDSVQQTRSRLLAAKVIASPRRGELAFELPYLAEYLRGEL
ncbi:MAG: hypothetical protein LBC97_11495 [Bifidobacteriaceae bacterium]|jgi:hypothetical protein|nr:hypothetical protein [Bifidobacteriaceae bacterium]